MKRGQVSVETLSIFALMFMLLIPVFYVFYNYTTGLNRQMSHDAVRIVGSDIVATAEAVYYLGEPSRIMLIQQFPQRIKNLTILGGREIVFLMDDGTEQVFVFDPFGINVSGDFLPRHYSAGEKSILLENSGKWVNVTIS